jgi:hypothetical protein
MGNSMKEAFDKTKGRDVDIFSQEAVLIRQLAQEKAHALDLLRELISNSAAQEVGATEIRIMCYEHPDYGWVFQVQDDGIGMDYRGDINVPGRLDKFLALGLSSIAGIQSDEFSYKGLGSKLAFQSRRIDIETWTGHGPFYRVEVNEPWGSLSKVPQPVKPRPKIFETNADSNQKKGTKISVYGHPPHTEKTYTFDEIKNYLMHRTFIGFTKERMNIPRFVLSVGQRTEELDFGFPTLRNLKDKAPEGTAFINNMQKAESIKGKNTAVKINLKGIYSLDAGRFGINSIVGSAEIILSVKGIPYFQLGLEKYTGGRRGLGMVPSAKNVCIVAECDDVQSVMNISRSGLNDSAERDAFEKCLKSLMKDIEESSEWKKLLAISKKRKDIKGAQTLDVRKRKLQSTEQQWVFFEGKKIHRRPENEYDTFAILWKLEGMNKLPFHSFESLEHGGNQGADIIVNLQESEDSEPEHYITVEGESILTHFTKHEHNPGQMRTIICWDIGKSRKIKIRDTALPFKVLSQMGDTPVRVYILSRIPGIDIKIL